MTEEMALLIGGLLTVGGIIYGVAAIKEASSIMRQCRKIRKDVKRHRRG